LDVLQSEIYVVFYLYCKSSKLPNFYFVRVEEAITLFDGLWN